MGGGDKRESNKNFLDSNSPLIAPYDYPDIVCFGMRFYPRDSQIKAPTIITKTLTGTDIIDTFFNKTFTPPWHLCTKVYHKSLISKGIKYIDQNLANLPKITMAEDLLKFFILSLFGQKSIGFKQNLYFYCDSTSSITRDQNTASLESKIKQLKTILFVIKNLDTSMIKHDQSIIAKAKQKLRKMLHYAILKNKIEKDISQNNHHFYRTKIYLKGYIKSLKYYNSWKIYVRILLCALSFGKIKI